MNYLNLLAIIIVLLCFKMNYWKIINLWWRLTSSSSSLIDVTIVVFTSSFTGPGESNGVCVIPFKAITVVKFITIQIRGKGILQINGLRFNESLQENTLTSTAPVSKGNCFIIKVVQVFVFELIRLNLMVRTCRFVCLFVCSS